MERHIYDLPIRVLIYQEEGQSQAHALEMDLVASGDTEKEAVAALKQMIFNQISFAQQMGQEHMIDRVAPREYFDRWNDAQKRTMIAVAGDKPLKWRFKAMCIVVTEHELEQLRSLPKRSRFQELAEAASAKA